MNLVISASTESESTAKKRYAGGSPAFAGKRLTREWRTVAAMVRCYCEDHHRSHGELCEECDSLLKYATIRLQRCRFGTKKPTCANCPVHCYLPARREEVKTIMRYAGPRMLWKHPFLSLRHWLDSFKPAPQV